MHIDLDKIKEDYRITEEDDDNMVKLKEAIAALTPAEQNIIYLYIEYGTYSDVARILNVSSPTVKKKIMIIKDKILNYE